MATPRGVVYEHVAHSKTDDAMRNDTPKECVCFWRETEDDNPYACFSNWHREAYVGRCGTRFATAEHHIMTLKARLFGDTATERKIAAAAHPYAAKQLGREVANFNGARWNAERPRIAETVVRAKFGQLAHLGTVLIDTYPRQIVEASPPDCIWGVGLSEADVRAGKPFRGLNELGRALMTVRSELVVDAWRANG
jgi:ribA/ribD-fused uncharacterized protein